jgi:hypothetical protein
MNYFWGQCPSCGCQVTIQYEDSPDRLVGSLRRWSTDRSVNDGRRLEVPRSEVAADGGFGAACVCGATVSVAASAIERAATERPAP